MARLPISAGVEIEFLRSNHPNLRTADYGSRAPYFNNVTFPGWKLWTDSSCGYELVSPVLRDDNDLDTMDALVDDLNAHNAKVDETCGLHVHIGVRGYDQDRIERMLQFLVRYEESFFLLAPKHRAQGTYSKPLAEHVFVGLNSGLYATAWTDRRFWINLQALAKHGTVEFRLMNCELDKRFIRGWVEFLVVLCYKLLNDSKTVSRAKCKVAFKRSEVKENALLMHNLLVKSEAFYGNVPNVERAVRARKWASDRFAQMQGYRHKTAINKAQAAKKAAKAPSPEDEYAYSKDGHAYNAAGKRLYV